MNGFFDSLNIEVVHVSLQSQCNFYSWYGFWKTVKKNALIRQKLHREQVETTEQYYSLIPVTLDCSSRVIFSWQNHYDLTGAHLIRRRICLWNVFCHCWGSTQAPRSTKERFAQEINILIQCQNNWIDKQLPQALSAEGNNVWIDLQEKSGRYTRDMNISIQVQ